MKPFSYGVKIFPWVMLAIGMTAAGDVRVRVDGKSGGRVFEGIGALSAGASSRLLPDYPEQERSDILDLLFRPDFGASLQHLKVEIGGDINSTDGSEPSHARTREEFLHPLPEYFGRGYEWWLMEEAKKRNPRVILDVLQWGAPPWIGDRPPLASQAGSKRFYSPDNAEYIASFIRGAGTYHGLRIDYCGVWNETPYDAEWITLLRRTLDRSGLNAVRIVAADQTSSVAPLWEIAGRMLDDTALFRAVHTIGVHYPGNTDAKFALKEPMSSTPEARRTGKPLWASEDGPWRGDWEGARWLAKMFNRNYIVGRMTTTIIWSLITSYNDNLPIPGSGPMKANTPWSGQYEVQPGIWAIAHTTQFAQPGWKYLDSACGMLPGGGSYVTLRNPENADWSMIIETMDRVSPETLIVTVTGGLSAGRLSLWRTTHEVQFEEQPFITPRGGEFGLRLEPNAIYSLTTSRGQQKGQPGHAIPPAGDFPLPYQDDFEKSRIGGTPRYFSDLNGAFEISRRPDGPGQCLRQLVSERGIEWPLAEQPDPRTMIGSRHWADYSVTCDVSIENGGWAAVGARFDSTWNSGYWLSLTREGEWNLRIKDSVRVRGRLPVEAAGKWHTLRLGCEGTLIMITIDGKTLGSIRDETFRSGVAVLGTGWNRAWFDNFSVHGN
jgi:hypothetical protein